MGLMDVTVRSHGGGGSIGRAAVEIDLGDGHVLKITAEHETDRYRRVRVKWRVPAHVTGPREQVRDLKEEVVTHAKLDLRTGEQVDTSVRHPILSSDDRGGR
jgi:hypothetical protein